MFGFNKNKKEKVSKKKQEHDAELLKQYEEGNILQVDGKTDNKEYFKGLNKEEVKEQPEETKLEDLPEIEEKEISNEEQFEGKLEGLENE